MWIHDIPFKERDCIPSEKGEDKKATFYSSRAAQYVTKMSLPCLTFFYSKGIFICCVVTPINSYFPISFPCLFYSCFFRQIQFLWCIKDYPSCLIDDSFRWCALPSGNPSQIICLPFHGCILPSKKISLTWQGDGSTARTHTHKLWLDKTEKGKESSSYKRTVVYLFTFIYVYITHLFVQTEDERRVFTEVKESVVRRYK